MIEVRLLVIVTAADDAVADRMVLDIRRAARFAVVIEQSREVTE